MKRSNDIESSYVNRQTFLGELDDVQVELGRRSIDYRIIGSIGAAALLGGGEIDFNRPGAIKMHQRIPDIDIIVPRNNLDEMRDLREEVLARGGPKLGLANATGEIDFLPEGDTSYLTHKDARFAVDSDLLRPQVSTFEGVDVKTLPIGTLLQTYGTFGGIVRQKDMETIRAMINAGDDTERSRMQAFYDFRKYRRQESPMEVYRGRAVEYANQHSPALIKNALGLTAIYAADKLGLR